MQALPSGPTVELSLPMPEGGKYLRFALESPPINHPDLAAKYPEIKTYRGRRLNDPSARLAFDLTPAGMHAQIRTANGAIYIDPCYRGNDRVYVSYYKRDVFRNRRSESFVCLTPGSAIHATKGAKLATSSGTQLRTYRLACAANSTFTNLAGNTVASGLAAVVVVMNRVSAIYKEEFAIRLQLIANNDAIIYPTTGNPTSGPDPVQQQFEHVQARINETSIAGLVRPTTTSVTLSLPAAAGWLMWLLFVAMDRKAFGTTGQPNPIGDPFNVDYVAHEMGHQFGGNHTFNGIGSHCSGGNYSGSHAYEPGSGTTIMAYAGICGADDDLAPNSDAYFLFDNISEIVTYTTTGVGNSCPVLTATGNTVPTVNAGPNHTIPSRTPFALTGSASDPDGDTLTYCWEERDLGPAQAGNVADNGSSPLFRTFYPTYTPARIFPKIGNIVAGIFDNVAPPHGETFRLPIARSIFD